MHIVHIASELAPIAKVGGLGDVVYGLSKELLRLGNKVEILLPKYDCLEKEQLKDLKIEQTGLVSYDGSQGFNNTIWSAHVNDLPVFLIETDHPKQFFNRGLIYGALDDIDRFLHFSKIAIEYLFKAGKQPDVIHLHDWPTATVAVIYRDLYWDHYRIGGTVLTLHNVEHQGKCRTFNLCQIGLKGEKYLAPDKMQDPVKKEEINLLKGGIVYADRITTVSPSYEKQIQTSEGGRGLEKTIAKARKKLKGILNGIDEDYWDPEKDPCLIQKYPTHGVDLKNPVSVLNAVLAGKKANKQQLRQQLGLKESDAPLVAAITRLVPQKSPELIKCALQLTLKKGGQFILLGSCASPSTQEEFETLREEVKTSGNAVVLLDQNERLAHQIYAGADMLVIPSLFEPCGLTQMIALRYATLPIARATGGLADTVFDIETSSKPLEERNGFTFQGPTQQEVEDALCRALECYQRQPQGWQSLMLQGIRQNHSWKRAAERYLSLYTQLNANSPRPF